MKKLLAMLLALAIGLIPMLALAEGEACTRTTITLDGIAALEDYSIVCKELHAGAKQYAFDVMKGEESLLSLMGGLSEDEGTLYFSASPMGDQILAFTGEDILNLLYMLVKKAVESGVLTSESFSDFINEVLSDVSASAEKDAYTEIDFSQLNLTPILMALLNLQNCVRIVDVENYDLVEERFGAEKDEEGNPKSEEAEEIEEELPELDPVCVEIFITLSADEAQLLVNAVCETIALNPSLMALFGDKLDAFTELQEEFISNLAEDLNIQIGLDDASTAVFSSMTFSLEQDDTIRSFVFENATEADEETGASMISLNGKYSDDTEMVYHYLFDTTLVAGTEDFQFTATIGDVDAGYITLSVSSPAAVKTESSKTDEVVVTLKGSLDDKVDDTVKGMLAGSELDYTLDIVEAQEAGLEKITATLLNGETAIAALNIVQDEAESMAPADLTNAVRPGQMDAEALSEFGDKLIANAEKWAVEMIELFITAA